MSEISVTTFKRAGAKTWTMQYRDPATGNKVRRSTGTTRKRDAEKAASKWADDINAGFTTSPGKASWGKFRERYETEHVEGLAEGSRDKIDGVLNTVERIIRPATLADLREDALGRYVRRMRNDGASESTIASHVRTIRAALAWAHGVKILARIPAMPKMKRAKKTKVMKGRAVSQCEVDAMLAAVVEVVGEERAASWRNYITGLWLSGLRLGESLCLSWDDPTQVMVDLSREFPVLIIPAENQKSGKDQTYPIAPEFAEFLLAVPADQRHGFVFNPQPERVRRPRLSENQVIRTVAAIGRAAGVIVDTSTNGKMKYASAHDLRRGFGFKWSERVMPAVLKELMRHAAIETSMKYYVGRNAQATAATLWAAHNHAKDRANGNGKVGDSTATAPMVGA